MTIYEKNMEALKEKYQVIYDALGGIREDELSELVHIEDARKGGQAVVYHDNGKSVYLNSKYDPENEASKYMANTFEMKNNALLIMYGLSNGYYVKEHIKHVKNTKCIVFEPSMDIFMQVISHIDISELIQSERFCLSVRGINTEEFLITVEKWLDMANKDANKIMAAPKYVELFQDGYEEFRMNCMDMYKNLQVVTYAGLDMGKNVAKNEIYNMLFFEGCRSGECLKNKFSKDMPAIIVGAGPSLEKNMDLINEAKGKALIIVVDTAVARVVKKGIKPDVIISIDEEKPVDMFKINGIGEFPFLAEVGTNRDVLEYVRPKDLFFISTNSGIWKEMFKKAGSDITDIEPGLSVATASIAALISWGFKRIIFIGQDLAFTGSDVNMAEDESGNYLCVKDINGEDILTRRDYYIYLKWMENAAFTNKDVEFIDATEGGALKKNFTCMTFREAIDKYCTEEYDIESLLLSAPKLFVGDDRKIISETLEKVKRNLRNLRKQLVSCKADCLRGKRILESGEGNVKELSRIGANIDKLIKAIEGCDERALIYKWTIASEIGVYENLNGEDDAITAGIRAFETNAKYFEEIGNAIPELIEIIDDCLSKII